MRSMKKQTVEFSSHTANLALLRNCVRKFLNAYPFSKKERLLDGARRGRSMHERYSLRLPST